MNLGLVLPESETIGRSRPLEKSLEPYLSSLGSSFINVALVPAKDRVGRLHYRSKVLRELVAQPILTKHTVERLRKSVDRLIFEVRCFDDRSAADDPQVCVYEFAENTLSAITNRVCPTSDTYLSRIVTISNELIQAFQPDALHYSYFRYQNLNQCFCQRCISIFARHSGTEVGTADRLASLLASNQQIFSEWVDWRATTIIAGLQAVKSGLKERVEISVEIDIDYRRNYLAGILLNEGLDWLQLATEVDENFLHVQPAGWPRQAAGSEETIQLLRYVVGRLRQSSVQPTLFFWFLQSAGDIKKALTILRESSAGCALFYDTNPRRLNSWLRQSIPK